MEEDEKIEQLPNLGIANWKFLLQATDDICPNKDVVKKSLLDAIKNENMAPFYEILCEDLKWTVDAQLLTQMKTTNTDKLKELEAKLADSIQNFGESEVREAMLKKADFFARIGDKEKAVSQYRLTEEQTVGSGQKLDVIFTLIRLGLFWMDHDLINKY